MTIAQNHYDFSGYYSELEWRFQKKFSSYFPAFIRFFMKDLDPKIPEQGHNETERNDATQLVHHFSVCDPTDLEKCQTSNQKIVIGVRNPLATSDAQSKIGKKSDIHTFIIFDDYFQRNENGF